MDTLRYADYYGAHDENRRDRESARVFMGIMVGTVLGALMWVPILLLILYL